MRQAARRPISATALARLACLLYGLTASPSAYTNSTSLTTTRASGSSGDLCCANIGTWSSATPVVSGVREGGENWTNLYLVFADRDYAGPGALRLAQIIRDHVTGECSKVGHGLPGPASDSD